MSFPDSHKKAAQNKNKKLVPRPMTLLPDILSVGVSGEMVVSPSKLTKLLLNVTIQRSTGPVQVVMSQEATVMELVAAALKQYAKEGRRPVLRSVDMLGFELHYSQFSLESLDMEEKLVSLGSRNFFLCPKQAAEMDEANGGSLTTTTWCCSNEADTTVTKRSLPWLKFMIFSS